MPAPSILGTAETPDSVFTTQTLTLNGLVAGDTLFVAYGSDYYTLANMPNPTSTAGTLSLVQSVDIGDNVAHIKTYLCPIGSSGTHTVTIPAHVDCDIHGIVLVLGGEVTADGSGSQFDPANTTATHTAPSVTTTGSDRLLVCVWLTPAGPSWTGEVYAPQASMTRRGETDASPFSAMMVATEGITASGATGTRTATWVAARKYGAVTVALAGASTATVSGTLSGTLPALTASASGSVTVSGTAAATLPSLTGDLAGAVEASGQIDATLPALTASMQGEVAVEGVAGAVLPSLAASLDGQVEVAGTAAGVLPALTGALDGDVTASADLTAVLPALTGTLTGQVLSPQGQLTGTLPALQAAFTGTSDAIDLDIHGLAGAPETRWPVGPPETRFPVGPPNT